MARKPKTRQINITYLILVEGETELIYFQGLKEYHKVIGVTIKMRQAKYTRPSKIIKEAIKEQESGVYHFVWCVYDCDVFLQQDISEFEKTHKIANDNGIQFAESMRSIETWFLLHFTKPNKAYQTTKALIKDLKKQIPTYDKTMRNLYAKLQPNEENVFKNVIGFSNIDYTQANTATNVDKLVEIFVKRGCV